MFSQSFEYDLSHSHLHHSHQNSLEVVVPNSGIIIFQEDRHETMSESQGEGWQVAVS